MTTVQPPGAFTNNLQMVIHISINNTDISLGRELKNIFQTQHMNMVLLITINTGNDVVSVNGRVISIMSRT